MPMPYYRRIQKTGGSTYIVSLPKQWVEKRLKKGDAVQILQQGDGLAISAGRHREEKPEAQLEFGGGVERVLRQIIAHYLAGANKFSIIAPKQFHAKIKQVAKEKIPGIETVEESENTLVIQNLLSHADLSFQSTLGRLHFLNRTLLEKITHMAGGEDLSETESEMDRFFILAFRQLGHERQSDTDVIQHAAYYAIIIKSLEKIADHAYAFSKEAIRDGKERKKLETQAMIAKEAYEKAMSALLKKDGRIAEEALEYIEEERKKPYGKDFPTYNLLRIMDCSADIAEMALDMYFPSRSG